MTISARKLYALDVKSTRPPRLEELEREFFSAIRVCNGANKTTWGGRLNDVETAIEAALQVISLVPSRCLDVGASSAISTINWLAFLRHCGRNCDVVAMDLCFSAYFVDLGCGAGVLADDGGNPLQLEFLGYGFRPRPYRRRDVVLGLGVVGSLIQHAFERWSKAHAVKSPREGGRGKDGDSQVTKLELVSPRARHMSGLILKEADLFAEPPSDMCGQFDVVRVANLLNLDYFDEQQILMGFSNIKKFCKADKSVVAVCRTWEDGSNHGTIFKLDGDSGSLVPVQRLGVGSEVESLAIAAWQQG